MCVASLLFTQSLRLVSTFVPVLTSCTRFSVSVSGACRDQNVGEGRGQKYQGSTLWLFLKRLFFRARPGKERCFLAFYQKCAARRENFYNFHPPIASQTPLKEQKFHPPSSWGGGGLVPQVSPPTARPWVYGMFSARNWPRESATVVDLSQAKAALSCVTVS